MKLIPILFSMSMVQALIAGRKTQTRRVIKTDHDALEEVIPVPRVAGMENTWGHWRFTWDSGDDAIKKCPYGQPGDVLWVRECFRKYCFVDDLGYTHFDREIIDYAADKPEMINMVDGDGFQMYNKDGSEKFIPWKPSIHMPYAACRIWLKVKSIHVERLHDISEEDAIAEGVESNECVDKSKCISNFCKTEGCAGIGEYLHYSKPMDFDLLPCYSARESFESLWESINGEDSLRANPWVWIISFEKTTKP